MRHQWRHVETTLARIYPHSEDSRASLGTYGDYRISQQVIVPALCRGLDDIGRNELLRTCHANSSQRADELGYMYHFLKPSRGQYVSSVQQAIEVTSSLLDLVSSISIYIVIYGQSTQTRDRSSYQKCL
jgi:hypothetical protein